MAEGLNEFFLYLMLPLVAFLYASVGHGGASSYLMVLALLNFAPEQIRPTALIMNMFVSLMAFLSFRKASTFPTQLFISLVIFSIPAAYFGGSILVDTILYKRILGILLFFPILKFLNVFPVSDRPAMERQWWLGPVLGLVIGFFSGLIGIGGGIILSPILLILGWTNMKETAAVSALFIFFNSVSGFLGADGFQVEIDRQLWIVMPLTIAGGALGAYLGAKKFNPVIIKYLLTIVLFIAAVKLIWPG
jgi:uncharacterized membrane protein YfcA